MLPILPFPSFAVKRDNHALHTAMYPRFGTLNWDYYYSKHANCF